MDKTLMGWIAMLPFLLCVFSTVVLALVRIINGQRKFAEIFRTSRVQRLLEFLSAAFMMVGLNLSLDEPRLLVWLVAPLIAAVGVRHFVKDKNRPPPADFHGNSSN